MRPGETKGSTFGAFSEKIDNTILISIIIAYEKSVF